MRAFEAVASTPWCIQEEVLTTILEIARRDNADPAAVAAKLGRPLNNTRTVTHRDGIAVVPVIGPVFRYANMFTEISGATSTAVLSTDFQEALANPNVKGILLEVDSPGGEAYGIQELAGMIRAARKIKPVIAYVSGIGASAAYWLASAASEVVLSPTSMVGSIGTVMAYRDTSERDAREGVKTIEVVSSQSPRKRPDLGTDEGRGQIQSVVDQITAVFVADVASNRGVGKRTVLNDFGGGGVLVGQSAVEAGMADRIGTFEQVVADLVAMDGNPRRRKQVSGATASDDQPALAAGGEEEDMDAQATLAAAQQEVTALKARVVTLESEKATLETAVQAQTTRATEADMRAAKAEALAAAGKTALDDLKTDYLENRIRLGVSGAEGEEVAAMLVNAGNYSRLKQLRDESIAAVFTTIRSGPSADVKTATEARQEPELNAAEKSVIQQQVQRTGKPFAECAAAFLAAKTARASRGLLA